MGAVKTARRLAGLGILLGCLAPVISAGTGLAPAAAPGSAPPDASALFSRTASGTLARHFSSPNISYLFYDAQEDRFIAEKWREPAQPVPIGSLVKPFTALAYAETHNFRFPEYVCTGGNSCWLPRATEDWASCGPSPYLATRTSPALHRIPGKRRLPRLPGASVSTALE